MSKKVQQNVFFFHLDYTTDIQSMWGYIVFAFPIVRSFIRTFVRLYVRSLGLSVTGSKFFG